MAAVVSCKSVVSCQLSASSDGQPTSFGRIFLPKCKNACRCSSPTHSTPKKPPTPRRAAPRRHPKKKHNKKKRKNENTHVLYFDVMTWRASRVACQQRLHNLVLCVHVYTAAQKRRLRLFEMNKARRKPAFNGQEVPPRATTARNNQHRKLSAITAASVAPR